MVFYPVSIGVRSFRKLPLAVVIEGDRFPQRVGDRFQLSLLRRLGVGRSKRLHRPTHREGLCSRFDLTCRSIRNTLCGLGSVDPRHLHFVQAPVRVIELLGDVSKRINRFLEQPRCRVVLKGSRA